MKKEYAEEVAAKIIEQLQRGTAPWQKPWKPGELSLPYNTSTGKEYRGINSMWLAMQGYGDPRWMTYNQANDAGAQVRKGSKGTKIVYWKTHDEENAKDAAGKPIIGEDGEPKMIRVALDRPRAFHAVVFNAEQIDGLPPLEPKTIAPEPERHARAEAVLANSGASIQHVAGNRAFYRPSSDSITLPERSQFDTADGYYATALHELGHWTGHPSRLDRDLSHPFGSEGYAREELRAEISSLMVGDRMEIGHDPGQIRVHAAYVGSWIKALQEDPREIFRAAADAEKIASFVMAFENEQTQEQARAVAPAEMERPAKDVQNEAVVSALDAAGWELRDGRAAIGHKEITTAVGPKDAFAYLSDGDGINRTLSFQYKSEGRNVTEADGGLIPVDATAEQAREIARDAIGRAENSINESYAVRLLRDSENVEEASRGAAQARALPEGWTEAAPGGMATNPDPQRGGIVDANMGSGNWFYIPNRDGVAASGSEYPTRDAAFKGLDAALLQHDLEQPEEAARQESLLGMLRQSTLTPSEYTPSAAFRDTNHVAIYGGDEAILLALIGPADDQASREMAERLVATPSFKDVLNRAFPGDADFIGIGTFQDGNGGVRLGDRLAALSRSEAGKVEQGDEQGSVEIVIVAPEGVGNGIAVAMATDDAILHAIDPAAPVLSWLDAEPDERQFMWREEEAVTDTPRYSDQTLQALIEDHGWEATASGSVRRQFEGVGRVGTMVTPNGERNLYAGYNEDGDHRRFIALTLGDRTITDMDGRDQNPADIARIINLKAEQFADQRRVQQGLEPIYAIDSPILALPIGNPQAIRDAGVIVEQYDMQRRQEAPAPAVELPPDDPNELRFQANRRELAAVQRADSNLTVMDSDAGIGRMFRDLLQKESGRADSVGQQATAALEHFGNVYPHLSGDDQLKAIGFDIRTGTGSASPDRPFNPTATATMLNALSDGKRPQLLPDPEPAPAVAVKHHPPENPMPDRTYLAVPYAEKEQAKAAAKESGFRLQWDKENKAWFAPAGADLSRMEQWKPGAARVQTPTAKSAEEQFSDALKDAGLVVDGPPENGKPIMDGKIHRVPVEGDRGGETSGAYAGHMEGRIPGGYIENYKTGERVNWKAEGTIEQTTPEERARLATEAAERQQKREAEQGQKQEATAAAAGALLQHCPAATADNAYCAAKGIADPVGLHTVPESIPEDVAKAHNIHITKTVREAKAIREADPEARVFKAGDLLIPARDGNGKLWTLQSVNPDFKSFMKGGRKHGLSALAGGNLPADYNPDAPIIVAEGYATADTVSKLARQPVVVAFDSGNLDAVVRELREQNPTSPLLIAADNDHEAATKLGPDGKPRKNVGMEKATAAATKHGAGVVAPPFKPGEKGSDWNDFENGHGEEDAQREFASQMALAKRDAAINADRLTTLARERATEQNRASEASRASWLEGGADAVEMAREDDKLPPPNLHLERMVGTVKEDGSVWTWSELDEQERLAKEAGQALADIPETNDANLSVLHLHAYREGVMSSPLIDTPDGAERLLELRASQNAESDRRYSVQDVHEGEVLATDSAKAALAAFRDAAYFRIVVDTEADRVVAKTVAGEEEQGVIITDADFERAASSESLQGVLDRRPELSRAILDRSEAELGDDVKEQRQIVNGDSNALVAEGAASKVTAKARPGRSRRRGMDAGM